MNKKKVFIIVIVVILIFISPMVFKYISRTIKSRNMTSKVEYIEIPSKGQKFYIKKIMIIEPAVWKGSYDGVLHYKDGRTIEIDVSYYGNFFGIKGEERGLFSKGVLYKYELYE
ncbi:UNVERIFIED_CONTAM: hypothetical protein Cloal_1407 [Acetivibrio alkalicellulosi]